MAVGMDGQVSWESLVRAVARRQWRGRALAGVTEDSRQVLPGMVFVARPGTCADGHDFVAAAAAAGAVLVVAEREVAARVPTCIVPSGARALALLAAAWHGEPARRLRLVGVTGTNGKTTVTHLVGAILEAAGTPALLLGTLGLWVAGRRLRPPSRWTTPPAPVLQADLARALAAGARAGALEVSAQALEQRRVDGCTFEVVACTNVTREHGEHFLDQDSYHLAKQRLFDPREFPGARAVVHERLARDPLWRLVARRRPAPLTFGWRGADVHVLEWAQRGLAGSDVELAVPLGGSMVRLRLRLPLPGAYNVENAACAAAIAAALGLDADAIRRGLEGVRHVPGRLQHVRQRPFRVIVDYAHNPASLRAVLTTVRRATPGRLVLVLGARGGRDRGKRPLMGAVAAALCDRLVLTSDRPAGEDPEEAAAPLRRAALDCGAVADFVPDRFEALRAALDGVRAGDTVLVAGKGDEPWCGDGEPAPGTTDVTALEALLGGGPSARPSGRGTGRVRGAPVGAGPAASASPS